MVILVSGSLDITAVNLTVIWIEETELRKADHTVEVN